MTTERFFLDKQIVYEWKYEESKEISVFKHSKNISLRFPNVPK